MALGTDSLRRPLFLGDGRIHGVFCGVGDRPLYRRLGAFGAAALFPVLLSAMAVLSPGMGPLYLAGIKTAGAGQTVPSPAGIWAPVPWCGRGGLCEPVFFEHTIVGVRSWCRWRRGEEGYAGPAINVKKEPHRADVVIGCGIIDQYRD